VEPFWIQLVKAFIVANVVLAGFAYVTLWERKLLGRFQARIGPNRAGFHGSLQPIADLVKLARKEDFYPREADPKLLYVAAPFLSVMMAIAAIALIPFGDPFTIAGQEIYQVGADLDIGLLLLFAFSGIGFYGLILGGWSSGNKYSLLGSARTAAQLVSYEVSLGLAVIGVVMLARSLSLVEIVDAQRETVWYILFQPLGFLVFFIAMVAEVNRIPFDLPESESELVSGYNTEYGGLKYAMFPLAEYVNMIVISATCATLFFGGFAGPWASGPWWLVAKIVILIFAFIWLRATLPRLRYDQLMQLGWKILLPLATLNLVVTAIIIGLGFAD
jgi:NADH-quinone oxidoreductase subunit H